GKKTPDKTARQDSILIYQAEPIEVKAEKPNEEIQSTVPVQSLDQQEIQSLSAINVADAVKHLPSVMLKDYGGIGGLKTISVRSLGAEHTAVFVNGIKYTDAQTGQVDLGRFGTDNLDRIELMSTGLQDAKCLPATAYTSTSSLNLVTDDKRMWQGVQPFHVQSSIIGGSFGYSALRLGGDVRISDAIFAGLNVDRTEADGEYDYTFQNGLLEEKHTRQNSDIAFTRVESDFGLKFSEDTKLQLKLYGYSSERGLPGAVIIGNNAISRQRLSNDEFFAQGTFSAFFFDKLETIIRAKYAYNYVRYKDPDYLISTGGLDDRFTQHEAYTSLSFNYPLNAFLSAGFSSDLSLNTLDASQFTDKPERLSWLSVIAIKASLDQFKAEASLLGALTDEKSYDKTVTDQKTDFLPSISAGYWVMDELHLRASFKKSFRLPTFNEMYYPHFGNTDIRPEYTDQFNVGIGFDQGAVFFLKRVSIGVDGFKIFTKDKIVAVPKGNLFNWSVQNIGRVETTGIELHGELETETFGTASLSFSANYTYQKALDKTPSSSAYWQEVTAGNQIAYTPVQTASFITSLLINTVTLSWQVSFVGHRYTSGEAIMENYLPGYTLHDLSARWESGLFGVTTTLKFDVNNLVDESYQVVKSFPMPGRSFRIGLTLKY
ncbi:MAG: TonB-dependent receptor, partial [Chlorobiales bacterium]|nr:TonB-dependent receptor [Chlorobiales bacterium]